MVLAYDEIPSLRCKNWRIARESWLWVASMCVLYGLSPTEIASAQNLYKPFTADGETVYPLTDRENNPYAALVIGEFTNFGASTKTGYRVISPVPLPNLWNDLQIFKPMLPTYTPRQNIKPKSIADGFNQKFGGQMESYGCPVYQKYAFRHLYNQLLEVAYPPLFGHD